MLVTDRCMAGGEDALVDAVAEAVEGGVNAVQLREKDLPKAELLSLSRRLREVTAGRALLLVNGPLDVALEARADGVHLPEHAPAQGGGPEPHVIVGRSVHSVDAAVRAEEEGAGYLVVGPVFETASHPEAQAGGLEIIRKVVSATRVPVLGIGGITSKNAADVMRAGASGVAVISAILGADFPGVAARELRDAVDGS
jgi:thiamine-phosphate pyrophosphorylase